MKRQHGRTSSYAPLRILVYSSNAAVRARVKQALGPMPAGDLAPLDFVDAATHPALTRLMESGSIDLAVLDGEATPCGGIGAAKQLKDELLQYLPIVVITARRDDAWLAGWAKADAVVSHPVDPVQLRERVIPLLHGRMLA
ncbi:response regulator [Mycolicibacterium moriokaense]|nr:response regulator [Mycolicibacterium moriokaense]